MNTAIVTARALLVSFAQATVYAQSEIAAPTIAVVGGTLIDVRLQRFSLR
jgi:hypothetical protein